MRIFSSRITTNQQLLCSQLSGYDIEIRPSQKADSFLRSVSLREIRKYGSYQDRVNCETYTAGIKQKPDLNNNHTVSQ